MQRLIRLRRQFVVSNGFTTGGSRFPPATSFSTTTPGPARARVADVESAGNGGRRGLGGLDPTTSSGRFGADFAGRAGLNNGQSDQGGHGPRFGLGRQQCRSFHRFRDFGGGQHPGRSGQQEGKERSRDDAGAGGRYHQKQERSGEKADSAGDSTKHSSGQQRHQQSSCRFFSDVLWLSTSTFATLHAARLTCDVHKLYKQKFGGSGRDPSGPFGSRSLTQTGVDQERMGVASGNDVRDECEGVVSSGERSQDDVKPRGENRAEANNADWGFSRFAALGLGAMSYPDFLVTQFVLPATTTRRPEKRESESGVGGLGFGLRRSRFLGSGGNLGLFRPARCGSSDASLPEKTEASSCSETRDGSSSASGVSSLGRSRAFSASDPCLTAAHYSTSEETDSADAHSRDITNENGMSSGSSGAWIRRGGLRAGRSIATQTSSETEPDQRNQFSSTPSTSTSGRGASSSTNDSGNGNLPQPQQPTSVFRLAKMEAEPKAGAKTAAAAQPAAEAEDAADRQFAQVQGSLYNMIGLEFLSQKLHEEAVDNFRRSADLGYAKGQYNLGLCLYRGLGGSRGSGGLGPARAQWRAAGRQGHGLALYQLGALDLAAGRVDTGQALMRKAADAGVTPAQTYLDSLKPPKVKCNNGLRQKSS